MAKAKSVRTAKVRTTTISVTKPVKYDQLESEFKLIRYVVPDRLRTHSTGKTFERIHSQLREQLDYPYKSYKFDKLDGSERWAVYVLYPKTAALVALHTDESQLEWREVAFDAPEFHLLLKLLQVQYFRGDEQGKFVGRDNCYIYAKRDGKNAHVCMQIDLIGDLANQPEQETQLFKVAGYAHKFVLPRKRLEDGRQYASAYYAISRFSDEGAALFQQVKPSNVIELSKKGYVYEQRAFEGSKATLDYYSLDAVERSRGYLLEMFIAGFSDFLSRYGFDVQPIIREFSEFTPDTDIRGFELPLWQLEVVSIYDVRKRRDIPIEKYRVLFQNQFPALEFEVLEQLSPQFDGVLLFIMDYAPEAFEEGMPLAGEVDPYKELYANYLQIPKQGLNVNMNDLADAEEQDDSRDWYLSYPMLDTNDNNVRNRITVSMNQLFLKDIVMRHRAIETRLPNSYPPYVFVRKQTQDRVSYEVALYIDGGAIQFLDLRSPDDRKIFFARLQSMNVDWNTSYESMKRRHRKDEHVELKRYDLLIGDNQFVEIEDINERVLYEFDEITDRQRKQKQSLPLSNFKLSNRYDDLRLGNMVSMGELHSSGLIDKDGNVVGSGRTKKQSDSLEFWVQLQHYDAVIEEMEMQYPEISFRDLCENEYWLPKMAQAMGKKPNKHGKFEPRVLKNLYKRIDMFPTDREGDLTPTYQGIWFDQEHRFIVGDINPLKLTGQAKAHLVRQFVIHQGMGKLDICSLLNQTSVRFVRLNQFTVYPFFFHLIDLYIENVLQYHEIT